jgi:FXSXX-COOH protein
MNSSRTEPGVESDLIDLDAVPLTTLRALDSEDLRHSMHQVVERTRRVHARYRSQNSGGGERID